MSQQVGKQVLVVLPKSGSGLMPVGEAGCVFGRGVAIRVGEGSPYGPAHGVHAGVGVIDQLKILARLKMRVIVDVRAAIQHGSSGYALRLQPRRDVVPVVPRRPLADERVQRIPVRYAVAERCEARIRHKFRLTDDLAEPLPLFVAADRDSNPCILAKAGIAAVR